MNKVEGNIVDIHNRKIFPGSIQIEGDKISSIDKNKNSYENYILPGFIDAHVHIESSMLTPFEFSKLVISKGTVAIINDPHEIANVLGVPGIEFMIKSSKQAPLKIFFTMPSCVPATDFDFSGGVISITDTKKLLNSGNFIGLSEMMNIPGVLQHDLKVFEKIHLFQEANLVIDGHAPGLQNEQLQKYIDAGITTDHECVNIEEALEKIQRGMKILIREGSAAKNYAALKSLIPHYSDYLMFCTDDSHPDDLISDGHIDKLVRRAIKDGFNLFDVLKIAILNPIKHYGISVGTLQVGDAADFIICKDLKSFETLSVYIQGEERYNKEWVSIKKGRIPLDFKSNNHIIECSKNKFVHAEIDISEISNPVKSNITAIKSISGSILTGKEHFSFPSPLSNFESDISRDILKIVYLNRYLENSVPQIAYITGVGLKRGAFATTVSHDSHNVIAIGTNDKDLVNSINTVLLHKGGLCVVEGKGQYLLPLPIAGIMSDQTGIDVAEKWEKLINVLKLMGCNWDSPFMTLSFMALLVVPELKIGEKGLFDYCRFDFMADDI